MTCYERDRLKCEKCGSVVLLHRHHVNNGRYFVVSGIVSQKDYKSFENTVVLCSVCHEEISLINSDFCIDWWNAQNKWYLNQRTKEDYKKLQHILKMVYDIFLLFKGDLKSHRVRKGFMKSLATKAKEVT